MLDQGDQPGMGMIRRGINNIYTVVLLDGSDPWRAPPAGGEERECRIKGKILEEEGRSYNPLAPGDRVSLEGDRILERLPRRNSFARWNRKRGLRQVLAANVDRVVCVLSPKAPPFRPRFADRVVIAAQAGGCAAEVVLNKSDQGVERGKDREMEERLKVFSAAGIPVARLSAETGTGIAAWADRMRGRTCVLVGQSGVGKTTLLNRLAPGLERRVTEISAKHNRGRHTTSDSLMYPWDRDSYLIDTPGIRELEPWGIEPEDLDRWYPDLAPWAAQCRFSPCSHGREPDCAVKMALEEGKIHPDRYTSYLSLREALERRRKSRNRYGG